VPRRLALAGAIAAAAFLALGMVGASSERPRAFDDVAVVGLAPGPESNQESIVQLYAARSYEWYARLVSVHTWLAFRRTGEQKYTVYEAHGFRPYLSGRSVRVCQKYHPDRKWHGAEPVLLFEVKGEAADRAITEIAQAVGRYPDRYRLWPGPNSNTFIAEVAREVPELQVDLPPTAIGKDYLVGGRIFGPAPSGTGWQISLQGLAGILVARKEGLEINLAGAVFGVDLDPPAVKLPIVGRLGLPEGRRPDHPNSPAELERRQQIPPEKRCH
jgi:Protein of unknown function (DUF3750)